MFHTNNYDYKFENDSDAKNYKLKTNLTQYIYMCIEITNYKLI